MVIGSRKRKVINSAGEKQTLIIRRLRCKGCRIIHHELPHMLIPYKRHCAETVEKIIAGQTKDVPCEGSTIRRIEMWWIAIKLNLESIIASLRVKYGAAFSVRPAPREIIRAVVNAHCWLSTRSAFLSG
jgi:hypothetical protein